MKKVTSWLIVITCILAMMIFLTTGCKTEVEETTEAEETEEVEETTEAAEVEPFKIATLAYLTGDLAFPALATVNAAKMAVEEVGEVLGRPVELVVVDAVDPNNQLSEAQKLMSLEGIKYFLGAYDFTPIPVARYINDNGGIYFDAVVWIPDIPEEGGLPGYFMMMPSYKDFGIGLVDFSLEWSEKYLNKDISELKVGVIMHSGLSYIGDVIAQDFEAKGVTPAVVEVYNPDVTDFTAIITKIRAADVDILIPCQVGGDANNFRKQCESMNYNPPIIFGAGVAYDQAEFADIGNAAIGCMSLSYTTGGINEAVAPGLKEFKEKFIEQNEFEPLTHSLQIYVGTKVFLQAVENAGVDDVQKIIEALRDLVIEPGVLPNYWGVDFDDTQKNVLAKPFIVGQWLLGDEGKPVYRVVYPEILATEDAIIPYFE